MNTQAPAQTARTDRPTTVRGERGRFAKGTHGRVKGIPDRRTTVDRQLLKAIAEKHLGPVLEKLFRSKSERIRFEAVRWTGEMLLGRPRQALDVAGFGNLADELATALRALREQRALNGAALASPPPLSGDRALVRAEVLTVEVAPPEGVTGDNSHLSEAKNEPERTPS